MDVLVFTNMYPSSAEPWFGCFVRDQVEDLRALGVGVDVVAFDGRRDRKAYGRAARLLRDALHRRPYDLVHAHYGLTGAVALTQRSAPVVTTFHGSDTGGIRWQGYVSWLVARAVAPIFVARANARRLGLPHAPTIACGVDTELFAPLDRRKGRRDLGWPEDGRVVLFPAARANAAKRYDLFQAALERVPGARGVTLEGFSRAEVRLVMNAADVTLMTSDAEGSPVTTKESLACGTPVVSVEVGDLPELLAGLPGCSIRRRDPDDLARGVVEAFEAGRPPELRERAEHYSRSRVAARVLEVYERTLAGRAA